MCEHLPKWILFFSSHRSRQLMNTSGSEHLASQVTTHEQMVEIVQYSSSSDLSLSLSLSLCLSPIHSDNSETPKSVHSVQRVRAQHIRWSHVHNFDPSSGTSVTSELFPFVTSFNNATKWVIYFFSLRSCISGTAVCGFLEISIHLFLICPSLTQVLTWSHCKKSGD